MPRFTQAQRAESLPQMPPCTVSNSSAGAGPENRMCSLLTTWASPPWLVPSLDAMASRLILHLSPLESLNTLLTRWSSVVVISVFCQIFPHCAPSKHMQQGHCQPPACSHSVLQVGVTAHLLGWSMSLPERGLPSRGLFPLLCKSGLGVGQSP